VIAFLRAFFTGQYINLDLPKIKIGINLIIVIIQAVIVSFGRYTFAVSLLAIIAFAINNYATITNLISKVKH